MMITPKRTLVIVAVSTLVGCSGTTAPATMPEATIQPLRLYATTATLPLVTDLTAVYGNLTFETRTSNFRTALNSLMDGDTPYIIATHLPSTLSLWAAPIAQDGIAVIVNPSSSLQGLTLDQLREIYQGRVLGGSDTELVIFSREDGADTRSEFERLVMGQRHTTQAARLVTSSTGMVDAVANTPGGIGYVSLAYLDSRVRALTIDSVQATQANVAANLYPLRSTVFIIGLREPQDAYRAFFGWIQSPEGQHVVSQQYAPFVDN